MLRQSMYSLNKLCKAPSNEDREVVRYVRTLANDLFRVATAEVADRALANRG